MLSTNLTAFPFSSTSNYAVFQCPGVIKHINEDFQVNESYLIDQSLKPKKDNHLLLMKKCGFSTFDAIRLVSQECHINPKLITYYGLKDEDAITQQLINVEHSYQALVDSLSRFNAQFSDQSNYIQLTYLQSSPHSLKVGDLLNNNFLITVRKLSESLARALSASAAIKLLFINYYGTQRFSLPHEDPASHLIGAAILQKQYSTAYEKLTKQDSKLGISAKSYQGDPENFFNEIDCREKNFFINAYYSYCWNAELKNKLEETQLELSKYEAKKLTYFFADSSKLRYASLPDSLTQKKVKADDVESRLYSTERAAILSTMFHVMQIAKDDCFPGYYKIQFKFSLPSGCYATMAIAQLLYQIEMNYVRQ